MIGQQVRRRLLLLATVLLSIASVWTITKTTPTDDDAVQGGIVTVPQHVSSAAEAMPEAMSGIFVNYRLTGPSAEVALTDPSQSPESGRLRVEQVGPDGVIARAEDGSVFYLAREGVSQETDPTHPTRCIVDEC